MRLVLASSNAGKLEEIRAILADAGVDLVAQSALGIDDAEETGATFVENALIKARHAARLSGLPALADDSGLCVDALGGAPGLRSARYAGRHGDSAANIARLLAELHGVGAERRAAHFHCTIVLLNAPDDPAPLIAEGRWRGSILEAPRGSGGHGYDPVFLDPGSGLSAAELSPEAKNAISHRGIALAGLRRRIQHSRSAG
ncbi:MAG TPA: RdgB/HAM1 family non-canonical purine NTP pyrophosphatase [Dokdonella sp.]|uniref:RdgB/HAM1 family non-canonical purine NTP pyrophosphatase n=1 Tax=Dokdonella sp. TaxID=2291710 RepID=UPI002C83A0E7|nr:RdgB/HAM1 family non-canonical purine NTP pyrophosphatase [Dokdonella sp.]HUD41075.1 RdgB/HAM1 family non-canonical purine NTP pyrophosphatase [Dokdonella sp.]